MVDLRTPSLPHSTLWSRTSATPDCKNTPWTRCTLSPSEVATLAIFARWARFGSERDFYRYAGARLSEAFPPLPERSQFNRCVHHSVGLIEEIALHLAEMMEPHSHVHLRAVHRRMGKLDRRAPSTGGRAPGERSRRRRWLCGWRGCRAPSVSARPAGRPPLLGGSPSRRTPYRGVAR